VGGWVGLRAGFRGEEHFLHIPTVEPRFLIEVLSQVTKSTELHWLLIWYWWWKYNSWGISFRTGRLWKGNLQLFRRLVNCLSHWGHRISPWRELVFLMENLCLCEIWNGFKQIRWLPGLESLRQLLWLRLQAGTLCTHYTWRLQTLTEADLWKVSASIPVRITTVFCRWRC
jgi:hypothetical protein